MAAALTRDTIDIDPRGGEEPLPGPLATGVGILSGQRHRKLDPPRAAPQIVLVLLACRVQMPEQSRAYHRGEHSHAVLGALTAADDDLVAREVDILDA